MKLQGMLELQGNDEALWGLMKLWGMMKLWWDDTLRGMIKQEGMLKLEGIMFVQYWGYAFPYLWDHIGIIFAACRGEVTLYDFVIDF